MKADPSHYTPFDADLRRAGIEPAEIDDLWYGVVVVDRDKRIRLSNRAAREILGRACAAESSIDLVPVETPTGTGAPVESALRGESRWCISCEPGGDTSAGPVSATTFPIRDERGAVVGAVLLCQSHASWSDEGRHALEARIHAAQQRELTSTLAHEVNQPLSAIYMYSQGCLRRSRDGQIEPDELREALEAISEQALRAGEIVRRLREYPSGDSSVRTPERLDDVVATALKAARPLAESAGFRFETQLSAGSLRVKIDRARVELAILHLIRNAIEASDAADPIPREIEIESRRSDGEVELRVADRGIGISEIFANRLSEPFTTTKESNRGLGLTFCKSIAQAHGGRLEVRPRHDGGTEAILFLPIEPEEKQS